MRLHTLFSIRSAAVAAVAAVAVQATAQQPAGPAGTNPNEFKVLKLSDLKSDFAKKPSTLSGPSAKAKEWGVLDVTFATAPEWIDGLTATFTVMFDNPKADEKKGERRISLFQTTIEYPDIAKGNDHKAGAVMLPSALLRFGRPIGYAVQFMVAGQEVGAMGVGEGILKDKAEWWKDPKILDNPIVQRRDGYLVDRMKSPFQLVDLHSYEVSR